jgi:hypothetical protein
LPDYFAHIGLAEAVGDFIAGGATAGEDAAEGVDLNRAPVCN